MKKGLAKLGIFLGAALALWILWFRLGFEKDVYQIYAPLPGQPELASWGTPPYDFKAGIATLRDIEQTFGVPDERSTDSRTFVWRSTYCDGFYVYHRWLFWERFVGGNEAFIPYTVVASFNEQGILTSWHRPVPSEMQPYVDSILGM